MSTLRLDKSLYDKIVQLLVPQVATDTGRTTLLGPIFSTFPEFYGSINWSGDGSTFAVHLIDRCIAYGEVETG